MLKHLREMLKKPPKPEEPDPLAKEHVIGEGLPADVLCRTPPVIGLCLGAQAESLKNRVGKDVF